MIKHSGVELHKFHVGDTAACSPSHCDTIARGTVWITGIQIDFAGTAGCKDDRGCKVSVYRVLLGIEYIGANAAVAFVPQLREGDQVNGIVVLISVDILAVSDPC